MTATTYQIRPSIRYAGIGAVVWILSLFTYASSHGSNNMGHAAEFLTVHLRQWASFNPGAAGVSAIVLALLFLFSVPTDIAHRKIKNKVTYPAIVAGLTLNIIVSTCWRFGFSAAWLGGIGFQNSIVGASLCFSGMFFFFVVVGCGAGDVKLMTAVGALVGWTTGCEIWFWGMFMAATFVVLKLAFEYGQGAMVMFAAGLEETVADIKDGSKRSPEEKLSRKIPLAPFFALGTLLALVSPMFLNGESLASYLYSIL